MNHFQIVMIAKICEKCDREMRFVPAGFSKTKKKPYSAFWSCDSRRGGCGATAKADGETVEAPDGRQDRLASLERKIDEILEIVKSR